MKWVEPKELIDLKFELVKAENKATPQKLSKPKFHFISNDSYAVVLYGKTLPAAYLVGWNPLLGEEPNKFVTPEALTVLQKKESQEIARILCPSARDAWDFKEFGITMRNLATWWGMSQDTEYMVVFNEALRQKFLEVWNPFFKSFSNEKNLYPQTVLRALDAYSDTTFGTLEISIYTNIAVWSGDGETWEPTLKELLERKTNLHTYRFTINVTGDRKELKKNLESLGAKYAKKALEDFKKELPK